MVTEIVWCTALFGMERVYLSITTRIARDAVYEVNKILTVVMLDHYLSRLMLLVKLTLALFPDIIFA